MGQYTHAGGLVARRQQGEFYYLVVRAKPNPQHWVIPKGHIEAGETPEEAARREVREETGVAAEIIASLGELRFVYRGEPVSAIIYLMSYQWEAQPAERREHRWEPYEAARALLTFPDTQALLEQARLYLQQRGAAAQTPPPDL